MQPVFFPLLPSSSSTATELLIVIFSDEGAKNLGRYPDFHVRRPRVHAALLWLVQHNPFYADVIINETALVSMPADGPVEGVAGSACPRFSLPTLHFPFGCLQAMFFMMHHVIFFEH